MILPMTSESEAGLRDMLIHKKVESYKDLFSIVKNEDERDIVFAVLYQLSKGNPSLQNKVQEHTEQRLDRFKSMKDVLNWVDDMVKTGAVQERKTTVCVLGNTAVGKSSLVRTLENYCKDTSAKPKPVLTGDPMNKSLIETKVMELRRSILLAA